jgi:hypothetical protein
MKQQTEIFRSGGHMRDMMLAKSDEKQTEPIYNLLRQETKEQIQKKSVTMEFINQKGAKIELNGSEWKLVDVLCELLFEQSINNKDPKDVDFYCSRHGEYTIPYGSINAPSERLILSLYEVTKKYKGDVRVSGKDIKTVEKILWEWENNIEKRVLIRYVREYTRPDKKKVVHRIETYQPLILIGKEDMTIYNEAGVPIEEQKDTIIFLNPIFRDQIETKYVNYPVGITKRMIEAYGKHDSPEIVFKLRDYLARELSSKRFRCEIGLEKLYWQLSEKWAQEGRKKLIHSYFERGVDTCQKIGLLKTYTIERNKNGEPKVVFFLNEQWLS